ncbi:hypothetical protein ACFOU2_19335 [Bacillus songklensis]|uniref:Acyclic terpene utilisation N-terminal domain-containing protein n=1 Tax=Bacillus songklensis TaxID=1069116 RepID=A0ABV8B8L5_9BACI
MSSFFIVHFLQIFYTASSLLPAFEQHEAYEIRLRVAGRAPTEKVAAKIGEEVEALYTNGPAGGGGARKYTNEVIGIVSILIPRNRINTSVMIRESVKNEEKII